MKRQFISVTILSTLLVLTSCGGSGDTTTVQTTTETTATEQSAPAQNITIETSTWAAVDLSTASTMIPVMLNLPNDAKIEKNGNGGVDVRLNEAYLITISNAGMASTVKEVLDDVKALTVSNTSSYKDGKIILEEPNGLIYSMQMNDEANGTKYQAEVHFAYCVEKEGAFYLIQDARPMDNGFLPGSTYTEQNAKTLYESVKATAKAK